MNKTVDLFGTYNTADTGPSRVTEGLARGLAELGVDVQMLTQGDRDDSPHENVEVVRIGESPNSILGFRSNYRAVQERVQSSDRLFHALEDYWHPADVRTVQWAFTSVDLLRNRQFSGTNVTIRELLGEIPLYALSRRGARRSDRIVAQSPVTERQLNQYWRLSADETVPLGIHESELSPPSPPSSPVRVLFPGRVNPKKGQVRVLSNLDPDSTDYDVDIVGSFDESEVPSGWLDRCHGFVDRERLNELYQRADIAVVPSYHENFSVTALEAIAHGCALVISNTCGFAQFVDVAVSNGVSIVTSGKQAAEAIECLVQDGDLAERKAAAHNLAKRYTWKRVAEEYITIYEEVTLRTWSA